MKDELKDMVKDAALEAIKKDEKLCGTIQGFVEGGSTPAQIEKMFNDSGVLTLAIGAYWYAKELLES